MSISSINVIGVGYIGSVISLYLAEEGYQVTAIDKNSEVLEKEEWFRRYNDLSARVGDQMDRIDTTDSYEDLQGDMSVIAVDTPAGNGSESADLTNLKSALEDLAVRMEESHTIVMRSTLPPGTSESVVIPLLERESGMSAGEGFKYCYAPEFIRGGAGMEDFRDPSKTVLAGDEEAKRKFKDLFPVSDNLHETSLGTAEAVKIFDNVFHGLKVSLANEAGRLGRDVGFDPKKVMDVISSDLRLNLSDMYMSPGNPYGGPCLPKDIEMIQNEAESSEVDVPVLESIEESNSEHSSWLMDEIRNQDADKIGIVGVTYKEGFNSSANSPALELDSMLRDEGYDVILNDPLIEIEDRSQEDLDTVAEEADILVVFNDGDEVERAVESFDGDVIDLTEFRFRFDDAVNQ